MMGLEHAYRVARRMVLLLVPALMLLPAGCANRKAERIRVAPRFRKRAHPSAVRRNVPERAHLRGGGQPESGRHFAERGRAGAHSRDSIHRAGQGQGQGARLLPGRHAGICRGSFVTRSWRESLDPRMIAAWSRARPVFMRYRGTRPSPDVTFFPVLADINSLFTSKDGRGSADGRKPASFPGEPDGTH